MRLLNTQTLELETFVGRSTPSYAILSHTWGADEVLLEDLVQLQRDWPGRRAGASTAPSHGVGLSSTDPGPRRWADGLVMPWRRRKRRWWRGLTRSKPGGWAKVQGACEMAAGEGHGYVWIDTCCIDKGSSAELSEAINSMFKWYRAAKVCYAFLVDVERVERSEGLAIDRGFDGGRREAGADDAVLESTPRPFDEPSFRASRWFTRGWTLQELIAPDRVVFLSRSWEFLGERRDMTALLSSITGIDEAVLSRNRHYSGGPSTVSAIATAPDSGDDTTPTAPPPRQPRCSHSFVHSHGSCTYCGAAVTLEAIMSRLSVAARMSWAGGRLTTREEDAAYSLLGLFGIHMPLLYGEGGARAFMRLQEEIMRGGGGGGESGGVAAGGAGGGDQSILASVGSGQFALPFYQSNLFAAGPGAFRGPHRVDLGPRGVGSTPLMALTNQGLRVELLICPCTVKWTTVGGLKWDLVSLWLGILDCSLDRDFLSRPAILLERLDEENWTFRRIGYNLLFKILPGKDAASVDLELGDSFKRKFEVFFAHEEVEMRSICLLTSNELGVKYVTPPLQIKLKQGKSKYSLKASYPRSEGHYIPSVEIKVRSYMESSTNDGSLCGVLCFDNDASDGFFVAWGVGPSTRTDSGTSSVGTLTSEVMKPPRKVPWCKIIEWNSIMGEEFKQGAVQGGLQFTDGELRVRFLNHEGASRRAALLESRAPVDMRCGPATVISTISSTDFLGRSVFELDIAIDTARPP